MFYIKDAYARAWKVVRSTEKYTDIRITTSEKDQDGNREYSTWFVRCVGAAHNKAKKLSEGDYIKILKAKMQNLDRKDEDGNFMPYGSNLTIIVFDIEIDNKDTSDNKKETTKSKKSDGAKKSSKKASKKEDEDEDEDDIDFDDVPF